ncbi:hypothetical protein [Kitasatospora brasiliensis]|uniref:hypothetical protein n=1 Tax=Kitasatospora brasiliensis TaxID=3058040 RepID=UPI0029319A97|nr:hypothetical protein [Kitasatospora sp. K002]
MERTPLTRVLLAACIFLIGLLAGLIAGLLSRAGGAPWPTAVRDGGAGFVAAVLLCITAAAFFLSRE